MANLVGTSTSAGPRDTLLISPIPLTTTADDIDHFLGMMVDSYIERDKDGVVGSHCYVRFDDETLAQEALKKDNQFLLGCPVKVCPTSVTLESLRANKSCSTIRVLHFKMNNNKPNAILEINNWYPNLMRNQMIANVEWMTDDKKSYKHNIAIITFKDSSTTESVMKKYEEMLEQNPIAAPKLKLKSDKDIRDHIDLCQKQIFWWEP